jgi:cytochrome b subunit of formate dehydrogenase
MGLNLVNWLAELDYKTYISAKETKVERLDLTSQQKRQVIVILFLLPFFLAISGLVVWLRTKVR